jgi:hypothetical protein
MPREYSKEQAFFKLGYLIGPGMTAVEDELDSLANTSSGAAWSGKDKYVVWVSEYAEGVDDLRKVYPRDAGLIRERSCAVVGARLAAQSSEELAPPLQRITGLTGL